MYRIAVCDDEPLMAEENVNMARRILNGRGMDPERDYQIDAYLSPDPLMEKLTAQPNAYDLLLLDIELSGESGVELAAFLREKRFEASIIYVTGHAGFALDSFPTRPLDYLLKPVNEERPPLWTGISGKKAGCPNGPCSEAGPAPFSCPASIIWRSTAAGPWLIWTGETRFSPSHFPSWSAPSWTGGSGTAISAIWSTWSMWNRSGARKSLWIPEKDSPSAGAVIKN